MKLGVAWLVTIAAVGAATAQVPAPVKMPSHQAEAQLAAYADCVVTQKRFRAPVAQFLKVVPDSAGFFPASMKAADMHCLDAAAQRSRATIEMRMQPAAFRAALYPALYRRDFGKAGPVGGIAALPPMSLLGEFDGDIETLPPEYRPSRALGDCVARAAPQGVHALMLAEPWKPGDDAAVEQLKPVLASCLSRGQTLRINRSVLRAATGEAMYKLSAAALSPARPAPAG